MSIAPEAILSTEEYYCVLNGEWTSHTHQKLAPLHHLLIVRERVIIGKGIKRRKTNTDHVREHVMRLAPVRVQAEGDSASGRQEAKSYATAHSRRANAYGEPG